MSEIVKPEPRTREWIESWRVALDATYMADNLPTRKAREEVHILCDMALNSLDLTTALENARKDAWQPIETAPKEGSILVVMQDMDGNEKWVAQYGANQLTYPGIRDYATHWQPLPEPPSLTPPTQKAT